MNLKVLWVSKLTLSYLSQFSPYSMRKIWYNKKWPPAKLKQMDEPKVTKNLMTKWRKTKWFWTNKIEKKDIGRLKKIRDIIGFCRFTVGILSVKKWEDLTKSLRPWPFLSDQEKLNNVVVTIKKWRRSTFHSQAFYYTCESFTTSHKNQDLFNRIW